VSPLGGRRPPRSSGPPLWRKRPITQRQREMIDELDLGYTSKALDELTQGEASDIIQEELDRRKDDGEEWDGWTVPRGGN